LFRGFVAKVGLSDLSSNTLYGALLTLKAASGDPIPILAVEGPLHHPQTSI
jgi:hypothetical protein